MSLLLTMLSDGVKEKEVADRVEVKDIAELVLEAIEQEHVCTKTRKVKVVPVRSHDGKTSALRARRNARPD